MLSKFEVIGEPNDSTFVSVIANHDSTQDMSAAFLGIESIKPNQLIVEHIAGDGDEVLLCNPVLRVVVHTSYRENALICS